MAPSPEEGALKHRLDAIYTDRPSYGVRRITAQVRHAGILVNHKAVARQRRELGLAGICPGPKLSNRTHQAGSSPELVRAVTAERPNHGWGIAITYLRLRGGWMYLVAVLDGFSRSVVRWAVEQRLSQPFVMAAVERALAQATPLIWNSDQGSHCTSPSPRVGCWRRGSGSAWMAKAARWTPALLSGCGGPSSGRRCSCRMIRHPARHGWD